MAIRLFVALLVSVLVLDVLPYSWTLTRAPKRWLWSVLNRVGLWQGEWSMFTPDPQTDNGWLSAEIVDTEQHVVYWNSPIWEEVDAWGKFYRFRHVNFYNRLPQNTNLPAWDDFIDYLARNRPTTDSLAASDLVDNSTPAEQLPISKISLFRNSMRLLPTDDGTLPGREETMWTTTSEFLTQRVYAP